MLNTSGHPSIDMFGDTQLLYGEPSFTGQLCEAGRRFVNIGPKGDVIRCGGPTVYGNVLAGTFKRAKRANLQYRGASTSARNTHPAPQVRRIPARIL
jgi:hypothetical protein